MKLLQFPTFEELEQKIKEEIGSTRLWKKEMPIPIMRKDEYKEADDHGKMTTPVILKTIFLSMVKKIKLADLHLTAISKTQPTRQIASNDSNLQDYLERQLNLVDLPTDLDRIIGKQIIGSIDEDGYLREPISITDDLL
ncbi:MAG: hypothetical protein IPF67_19405 [Saprospiraceae bacterium]|nr:hypothetical protein [Candidatus Brachybacter algidus]